MKIKKLFISLFLGAFILVSFSACANGSIFDPKDNNPDAKTVGVSMPTKSLERWNHDGNNIRKYLEDKGYNVRLTFADNKIDQQVKDIESLIPDVDLLIISPVDGYALSQVLKDAKRLNVPVISYDKLIQGSDAISYYVSFDNWKVGYFQGSAVLKALNLTNPADTSHTYNMEIVAGEPTDNNALQFFDGSMSALKPYIDSGVLKIPSGQTTFEQCSTKNYDSATAMNRMQNILATYYSAGEQLDICLCCNDAVALGALQAIETDYSGKNSIIITGQDGDEANLANIVDGKQTMTIYKPIVYEATVAVEIADSILHNIWPGKDSVREFNLSIEIVFNNSDYNGGFGPIDSFLLTPIEIDKFNIQSELVDRGFYYWDENGYPKVVK